MKAILRPLIAFLAAGALLGCPHYAPPVTHPVPAQFTVRAGLDTTWAVLESYIASVNAPVDLIDRKTGIIATKPMPADPAWLDCGKRDDGLLLSTRILSHTFQLSIAIRDLGPDSTAVRIDLSGKEQASVKIIGGEYGDEGEISCTSTGVFEGELLRWMDGEVEKP